MLKSPVLLLVIILFISTEARLISRKGAFSIKEIEEGPKLKKAQSQSKDFGFGNAVYDLTGKDIDGNEMRETVTTIRSLAGKSLKVYFSRVMDGMHAVIYIRSGPDEYYRLEAHDSYRKLDNKRINLIRIQKSKLTDKKVRESATIVDLNCEKTIHELLNSNGVTDELYNDDSNCSTFVNKVLKSVGCINENVTNELKDTLRKSRDDGFNDNLTKSAESKIN